MFGNRRQSEDHIADLLLESLRVDNAYVYTHIRIYIYIHIYMCILYIDVRIHIRKGVG